MRLERMVEVQSAVTEREFMARPKSVAPSRVYVAMMPAKFGSDKTVARGI
jgi:hypothetical protein